MPTGDYRPVRRVPATVEPELFEPDKAVYAGEPGRKELILKGRAALADLGVDPDSWVDAETEAELRNAISENTVESTRAAWGAMLFYTGFTGRRDDPPTSATIRQWIKDHWHMTRVDEHGRTVKRGRQEQPYAPATVAQRVYLVASVCRRLGWAVPTDDPKVSDQLTAYRIKFEDAGFKSFEADPMTPELSAELVRRACDLGTINGLRNATAFRLQFDTGCRATEMLKILGKNVRWLSDDRAQITFVQTKGRKPRTVSVEAVRDVDWDVDPVRLLSLYTEARRSAGLGDDDPFFTEVSHAARRRKDFDEAGVYAGSVLRHPWTYDAYQMCWDRAVKKSCIDIGPKGTRYRFPSHANRAGMITRAVQARIPLERVAKRSGHAPGSPVIHRYYRADDAWGDDNIGVTIRRRKAEEELVARIEDAKRRGHKNVAAELQQQLDEAQGRRTRKDGGK